MAGPAREQNRKKRHGALCAPTRADEKALRAAAT